jgi:TRAP-type C4-dicarboxylate transport system substrate-binding protein
MYTGISEGTADVGLVGMAVLDSSTSVNQIFSSLHKGLPEDDEVINDCYWEAIDKIPAISEELAKDNLVRVGLQSFAGSETLFCSKKPINSTDDFKGMIIQSSQSLPGQLFTSMGASTVAMEISDFYNSLDRGVTDAVYDSWASFYAQKLMEIGTDYFQFGNGGISAGIINVMMNKTTFDKLSPEQQDMVYEAFDYGVKESLNTYNANQEQAMKAAEENANMVILEGDDLNSVYEKIDAINESWFKSIEDAGYSDIREYYETLEEILDAHK